MNEQSAIRITCLMLGILVVMLIGGLVAAHRHHDAEVAKPREPELICEHQGVKVWGLERWENGRGWRWVYFTTGEGKVRARDERE